MDSIFNKLQDMSDADVQADRVYDDISVCEDIATDNNINGKEGDIKGNRNTFVHVLLSFKININRLFFPNY